MIVAVLAGTLPACKQKAPEATATPQSSVAVKPTASPPAPNVGTPTSPSATAPFEGEIQMAVYAPSAKTPATIAYDVKGDKIRSAPVNAPADAAHVVGDLGQRKAYAVVDASKSYTSVDVDAKGAAPAVSKTGKVERVQGRECEDWVINDAGERFDVCAAKGIAYVDPKGDGAEPAWAATLTKEHAFPLRVVATDKAGKQEFRAEATRIEQRRLDDALFKVPNDYRVAPLGKTVKVASIP
jgi:hypothetical protein